MEGKPATEKPELDYNNPDDSQGGIRRRLRDRDLLKKRKAEVEEKATTQWVYGVESKKKRLRGEETSSSGKRGRPRKNDQTPVLPAPQEELEQEAVIVEEVPKKEAVIVEQMPKQEAVIVEQVPQQEANPASSTPLPSTSFPDDPSPPETLPTYVPTAPYPIPILAPAPVSVVFPAPVLPTAPAPVPALSPLETLYSVGSDQASDPQNQVLIEDLGPDDEEDIPPSQAQREFDQGSSEETADNLPEPNIVYTAFPVFSSGAPLQDPLTGTF
ncbi:hypothetical protein UPYG_G00046030 [Umbra pygmaea]|uniref:Hemogen n=1 Tax=Umbra pygmaea TaxID=75934 RepID=A0ABD0Y9Q5_UMBPY